jgi:hypothetical protein
LIEIDRQRPNLAQAGAGIAPHGFAFARDTAIDFFDDRALSLDATLTGTKVGLITLTVGFTRDGTGLDVTLANDRTRTAPEERRRTQEETESHQASFAQKHTP